LVLVAAASLDTVLDGPGGGFLQAVAEEAAPLDTVLDGPGGGFLPAVADDDGIFSAAADFKDAVTNGGLLGSVDENDDSIFSGNADFEDPVVDRRRFATVLVTGLLVCLTSEARFGG